MRKHALLIYFYIALISTNAFAGLPPTTSKASGDSANVVTFSFQFPNFTVTHTGPTAVFNVLGLAGGGSGQVTANAALNAFLPSQGAASGLFLKSDGTNTSWATPSSTAMTITAAKTANYSANANEFVPCDFSGGSFTVTLPAASTATRVIVATASTSSYSLANNVAIARAGSDTIMGASTSLHLYTPEEVWELISDGTSNWKIVQHKTSMTAVSYSPTYVGFGTVTNNTSWWQRQGNRIRVDVSVTTGTVSGSTATITLPGSITAASDIGNLGALGAQQVGYFGIAHAAADSRYFAANRASNIVNFVYRNASFGDLQAVAGNSMAQNTESGEGWFEVRITNWEP